jgi:hypothetical protein
LPGSPNTFNRFFSRFAAFWRVFNDLASMLDAARWHGTVCPCIGKRDDCC